MRNLRWGNVLSYILILQLVFLSAGAYFGGISLMADPSGDNLQMPLSHLANSPFSDYFWPGAVLFLFIGILPTAASIGLVMSLLGRCLCSFLYRKMHWGWTMALISGLCLILWMDTQIIVVGYQHPIQALFMVLGVIITLNTLLPGILRRHERAIK